MSEKTKRHVFVLAMVIKTDATEEHFFRSQYIWLSDNKVLCNRVASHGCETTPMFFLEEMDFQGCVERNKQFLKNQFERQFNALSWQSKVQIVKKWKAHFDALDLPISVKNQIEMLATENQENNAPRHPLAEGVFLSDIYQSNEGEKSIEYLVPDQIVNIYHENGINPNVLLHNIVDKTHSLDEQIATDLMHEITAYLVKTSNLVPPEMRVKLDEIIAIEKLFIKKDEVDEKGADN